MTPNLKDGCLSAFKIDPFLSEQKIEQLSSIDWDCSQIVNRLESEPKGSVTTKRKQNGSIASKRNRMIPWPRKIWIWSTKLPLGKNLTTKFSRFFKIVFTQNSILWFRNLKPEVIFSNWNSNWNKRLWNLIHKFDDVAVNKMKFKIFGTGSIFSKQEVYLEFQNFEHFSFEPGSILSKPEVYLKF